MRIIAWISEQGAFAQKAILGKPCRAYVQEALGEIATLLITGHEALDALRATKNDVVLVVREDAPGLTAQTLESLAHAATSTTPCVLMSLDTDVALALAISSEPLLEFMRAQSSLPSVASLCRLLASRGIAPCCWHGDSCGAYFAVTDAASYADAFQALNYANIMLNQENGVIILDPARTVIEGDVQIGAGTMVYAGNTLQGKTIIGENCVLYPNNRMENAVIGDETTIESSVLLDCAVGAHTTIGPYAYLRPNTKVGQHCRIGDFVEIKNSSIDDGTKVSHLTYVGDSDLGKNINLGCGVVFVNYDGKQKSRSKVEDHAFIGCNCNLVAPVHVGESAYLAAGSTVVADVPANALFVARSRGVIKENWVLQRKKAGKL